MTSVILPRRRAYQIAFWVVACAGMALVTAAGAHLLGAAVLRPALAVVILMLLPGLVWRPWFEHGLGAWNRAVRLLFGQLRVLATWLCFYAVFPLLRRAGTGIELAPPVRLADGRPASMWHARDGAAPALTRDAAQLHGWLAGLVLHARHTGNWWLLALVPFIATLVLLATEPDEHGAPDSTYTLY